MSSEVCCQRMQWYSLPDVFQEWKFHLVCIQFEIHSLSLFDGEYLWTLKENGIIRIQMNSDCIALIYSYSLQSNLFDSVFVFFWTSFDTKKLGDGLVSDRDQQNNAIDKQWKIKTILSISSSPKSALGVGWMKVGWAEQPNYSCPK